MHAPADLSLEALAGEILGAPITLEHPGMGTPVRGTLVDETLGLFIVRLPSGRIVRVAKSGAVGTIALGGREIPLSGDQLRVRPEDRTKRLSLRGSRGGTR
ncbi:MAG TPA: ribonuclease P protein subunit [Thermoplasmata archaeon]|jgi:RNase P/RNase MRP subunit p29|nr:ribonuclease P protein subunit [Thermoplasmata archaeon]